MVAGEGSGSAEQVGSAVPRERFSVETARKMFGFRGKSPSGQGVDVSIIREHYHPDVEFRDAIQAVTGRDAVIEMMLRFPQRCHELRCIVHEAVQDGDVIFVEWTTEMRFRPRLPIARNNGASKLKLDADGMVIEHRDYFDLWGDMLETWPKVDKVYRSVIKHME